MTCNYCVSRIIVAVTLQYFVVVDRPTDAVSIPTKCTTTRTEQQKRAPDQTTAAAAAEEVLQFNGIVDAMRD